MRKKYIIGFLILLVIEILIALFVHGGFIRNYLGDVIVVWVVYCFVKMIFPKLNSYFTAIGVMLFAFVVEFLQAVKSLDKFPSIRISLSPQNPNPILQATLCGAENWNLI